MSNGHYVPPEDNEKTAMWDCLLELGVSEETIKTVVNINGYRTDVLEDILYATTGYRSFEQVQGEPGVDF